MTLAQNINVCGVGHSQVYRTLSCTMTNLWLEMLSSCRLPAPDGTDAVAQVHFLSNMNVRLRALVAAGMTAADAAG